MVHGRLETRESCGLVYGPGDATRVSGVHRPFRDVRPVCLCPKLSPFVHPVSSPKSCSSRECFSKDVCDPVPLPCRSLFGTVVSRQVPVVNKECKVNLTRPPDSHLLRRRSGPRRSVQVLLRSETRTTGLLMTTSKVVSRKIIRTVKVY